jgi:hypothetical protein
MIKKALLLMLFLMFISTNAMSQSFIFGQIGGGDPRAEGMEIQVELWKSVCGADELVATTTTDTAGNYFFDNLADHQFYEIKPVSDYYQFTPEVGDAEIPNITFSRDDFQISTCKSYADGGLRFLDMNDGTILDTCNQLLWLKNHQCKSIFDQGLAPRQYYDAVTWIENLQDGSCGLSDGSEPLDWCMPRTQQLINLSLDPPPPEWSGGCEVIDDLSDSYVWPRSPWLTSMNRTVWTFFINDWPEPIDHVGVNLTTSLCQDWTNEPNVTSYTFPWRWRFPPIIE